MPWLSRSPCVPLPTVSEGEAIFTKILRENNISTAQTLHSPLSATPLVCENCLLFYCFPRLLRACLETNFLQSKLKSRIYLIQKNVWPCANSSLTSFVSMNKCPKRGAICGGRWLPAVSVLPVTFQNCRWSCLLCTALDQRWNARLQWHPQCCILSTVC